MALSNHLAQGGQTFLHKVRMLRQVLGLAFRLGFVFGLLVFGFVLSKNVPSYIFHDTVKLAKAKAIVFIFGNDSDMKNDTGGTVKARDYATHKEWTYNVTVFLPLQLKRAALWGGGTIASLMFLAFLHWSLKGRRDKKRKHLSGSQLISAKELRRILDKKGKASDLTLGGLPLVKDSETQHILITGTTGSGKTNCFNHLLPQIRARRQRAVIVDTTGEFVAQYFRPDHDILLNPLDARSYSWSPWAECSEEYHYEELAANLIPQTSHDPFWTNAARTIFSEAMVQLKGSDQKISSLLHLLNKSSLKELSVALDGTDAKPLVDPSSERTAASIRATLSSSIKCLGLLKYPSKPFSIREWVQSDDPEDDSWLFIVMTPEQRQALRPLVSAWTSIAIKSLLGRTPHSDRRLWICIDELPSLHKLGDLQLCLAEGRKYGAAMVLGLQNTPQLEELYGHSMTKTMMDLCSTKLLFRAASYEMAESLSRSLGYQEIMEVQEGISYGANDVRDGVNLNMIKQRKLIVEPDALISLENLEAFVRLSETNFIGKIKLEYASPPNVNRPFIPRKELENTQEDNVKDLDMVAIQSNT